MAGYLWFQRNVLETLPTDLSAFKTFRPPTAVRVFDVAGREVDSFYTERRIWIPIESLSPLTWQAFVDAEDHRFFKHPGVDLRGILRAAVVNLRTGTRRQGGSTITQQVVKNLVVGAERSYTRKLREAVLARRLERELGKMGVLELYLNLIALGSGNFGIEAAARDYFDRPASQLDPGQAAMLAGLVPAPSRFSPREDPATAAIRRRLVLRRMVRSGHLTAEAAAGYADHPVLARPGRGPTSDVGAAYFTLVRRAIRDRLGGELPFEAGLQVHTPYDAALQRVAEGAAREAAASVDERQSLGRPVEGLSHEEQARLLLEVHHLDGTVGPPSAGDCFHAVADAEAALDALRAGPFTFRLAEPDAEAVIRSGRKRRPTPLSRALKAGDVLRVCLAEGDLVQLDRPPTAEAVVVVLENATGRVLAITGGHDTPLEGFVRAAQARRQPGSAFKPFVYAAALVGGRAQLDVLVDEPVSLPAGGGRRWRPANYDNEFRGKITLRRALAQSINTIAVKLTVERTPRAVVELATAMGLRTPLRADASLALGSSEVTPLDLAVGYATIARGGVRPDAVLIDRVTDADGREVGRAGAELRVNDRGHGRLPGGPGERVLPAAAAYELADMLREVVRSGTARTAHRPGLDRAGKTGTTNDYVDAWFAGFTPRHTVVVWVGTDGHRSLGDDETGGRAALPAWIRVMEHFPVRVGERLPVPDEAALVRDGDRWVALRRGAVPGRVLPLAELPRANPLPPFPGGATSRAAPAGRPPSSSP